MGKRIKWGNIIIFFLIIAAAVAAFYYKNPGILKNNSGTNTPVNQQNNNNDEDLDDVNNVNKVNKGEFVMGLDSWIGGTPVLMALEREYNKDYLLDMKVEYIPNDVDRIKALRDGRIQATEMSLPSFIRFQEKYPESGVVVGITDFSRGADGIIAKSEVKDLNDMEGRKISYVGDGTGKFILNKFLRLTGLRYQDIKPVEREEMGEVIGDLKSGSSDLVVSWSPEMDIAVKEINALKPDGVKVLITTEEVPELVPTVLVVNPDVLERYPKKVANFLRTWFAASKYIIEKPDKAYEKLAEIMDTEEYGEVTANDIKESFSKIKLMSLNDNLEYFGLSGTKEKVGTIINDTVQTWKQYGDITENFEPTPGVYTNSSMGSLTASSSVKELLVGALNFEKTGNEQPTEKPKQVFEAQDDQSIEKNTEKVAKVDIPPVYYNSGKASVKSESVSVLNEVVGILMQFPNYYLIVDAHTDSVGSDDTNLKLSRDRAAEVKNYLVSQGIDQNRIVARGWGEYKPVVASENTEEDRAKNRRTEFILARKTADK
ncbi:MAG: OmpA family protein [Clostridiaceae bacterium]|nr:OmpA family protein [Clostridiaceae bacterium]